MHHNKTFKYNTENFQERKLREKEIEYEREKVIEYERERDRI